MMINTTFIFDGEKSTDYNLHSVRIDASGMTATPFIGSRSIIEDVNPKNNTNYFYGISKEPITFKLTFSLLDEAMTPEKKMRIARWLFQDEYKEFQTTDYLGKVFYTIAINESEFMTADNDYGYFEVEFRTNANHAWSKVYSKKYIVNAGDVIELTNKCNVFKEYAPEIQFKLLEGTTFSLQNLSYDTLPFTFSNLNTNEVIYVNNGKKVIITDNESNPHRLGNFNRNWMKWIYGINRLRCDCKAEITFRYQFPIYV